MENLADQIAIVCHDVRITRERMMQKHPTWVSATDARIGVFSRFVNVLESARFGLIFEEGYLKSRSWWRDHVTSSVHMSDADISIYILEFDRSTRIGFLQGQFSAIETFFRLFIRAVDPAFLTKTTEFANIYRSLFKRLGLQRRGFEELLDLLREIRNTVHNNGVYFPSNPNRQNIAIPYKGQTYHFDIGKGTTFGLWTFYFSLVPDITQMLVDVVEAPEVATLPQLDDTFTLSFPSTPIYN